MDKCEPLIVELAYHTDSAAVFAAVADHPGAVLLDSGPPEARQGRFDILACDPWLTVETRGEWTALSGDGRVERSREHPLDLLRALLGTTRATALPDIPFAGGVLGYFGYDLARRLTRLPALARDEEALPELAVGLYDWALVVDHGLCRSWLVGSNPREATRRRWRELQQLFSSPSTEESGLPFSVAGPIESNLSKQAYAERFRRIQAYLRNGDCYQVNFAQRFAAPAAGSPWALYRVLRRLAPAPFGAYLSLGRAQVLCSSPEQFLHLRSGRVQTRPIKGTSPRDADPARDRDAALALGRSAKDRAENLMIVDLLRNDLGKVCAIGSIEVPQLFEIESYSNVHHLVSTVTGRLAPGRDALDLLRACFPGGSVTGAPKLRAMQIIEELEPNRRGVYCGSIGYIGYDGEMDSNIAIRTMACSRNLLRFWAGGGIVADSSLEGEYRETFDKASAMMRAVQHFEVGYS